MMEKVELKWYDIMAIAFTSLAIVMILWRVLGHSPLDLHILVTVAVAFGGWLYHLNREVGEIKVGMTHSFNKVREDFGKVKEDIHSMKNEIMTEISKIKSRRPVK